MAASTDVKEENDIKIRETRGEISLRSYLQVMNSYGREIIFVVALIFTALAALQNGPLKTKKVNPPQIFFKPPSLVTDFYQGDLNNLISLLSEKDISLVVYYAPWDASSMQAREEIEIVARFYHNEVYFAAINCWWPDGECSKKYTISVFPLITAQVHEVGTIRYDGPLISSYMISFLDSVLSPLVPLLYTGELLDLLTKHEGVLIAFFEFKNGSYPNGYSQFYQASIRALTEDPHRRLCFAVITNKKVALSFKLKSSVQLILWNSTEIYDHEINAAEILRWAYSKLKLVTQWISPTGSKSRTLSEIIEKKPTLILFAPRNLLLELSPYYHLFREVALDYNNCDKSSYITAIIHRMVLQRHVFQGEYAKLVEKCHRNTTEYHPDICRRNRQLCDLTCCQVAQLELEFHQKCHCRVCLHHTVQSIQEMKLSECENTLELILKNFKFGKLMDFHVCSDVEASYPVKFGDYKRLSVKCSNEPFSAIVKKSKDYLTEEEIFQLKDDHILMMIQNNAKKQCHRLKYAFNYTEINFPSFPSYDDISWRRNFSGLGCRTNRSLAFVAMDIVLYHAFAENLGLNVLEDLHQTAVVITEAKQESQYILKENLNKQSLIEFIKNYTIGALDRYLRMPIRKLEKCHQASEESICVEEITTATFSSVVLDETKDVVLLYYASWCGACSSIAHIYLSVSDYFSNIKDIKFARISGEDNDLPWEYTVEKYPTIIFFPAHRKAESVAFPPHLSITMTNLLHFVLTYTQPKIRWMVAMEMCNRECIALNLVQSTKELRRLYREQRVLLNDLHFVWHVIHGFKYIKVGDKLQRQKTDFNLNYYKTVYMQYLIDHIHDKRKKINQTLQLQIILRKKRDFYLQQLQETTKQGKITSDKVSDKKTKFVDLRQKDLKDEL